MTEEEVARVLEEHIQSPRNNHCNCGWRPDHSDPRFMYWFAQHREHVAAILVAYVKGIL